MTQHWQKKLLLKVFKSERKQSQSERLDAYECVSIFFSPRSTETESYSISRFQDNLTNKSVKYAKYCNQNAAEQDANILSTECVFWSHFI